LAGKPIWHITSFIGIFNQFIGLLFFVNNLKFIIMIFWGTFFSKQKQKKCEKIAIKSHQLYDHNKKKEKK